MNEFIVYNLEYISIFIIISAAVFKNYKIYKLKSAMTLSYKPNMLGVLASLVVLSNSSSAEMKIVMIATLISSFLTMVHIIYRKRNGCNTKKDDFRIFVIAFIGSTFGVFGSSLAYLSLVNLHNGLSSISLMAIFLGIVNYSIMLFFLATDSYVIFTLSLTVFLQSIIFVATLYNHRLFAYKTF